MNQLFLDSLLTSCLIYTATGASLVGGHPHRHSLALREQGLSLIDLVFPAAGSLCHLQYINYLVPDKAL